jgi:hypothetical protein
MYVSCWFRCYCWWWQSSPCGASGFVVGSQLACSESLCGATAELHMYPCCRELIKNNVGCNCQFIVEFVVSICFAVCLEFLDGVGNFAFVSSM